MLTGCVFAGRAARPLSVEVVALERLALLAERRVLAVVRAAERVRAAQRAQRRSAARAAPQRRAARHARPADTQLLHYTFTVLASLFHPAIPKSYLRLHTHVRNTQ